MDLEGALRRHPAIALVYKLAHTNVPGSKQAKRWQDVEDIRNAGIDVITTVNVQHLESVKDLVEKVTGIPVRETLPDRVLDGADEILFIDITPEALRKRVGGPDPQRRSPGTPFGRLVLPRHGAGRRRESGGGEISRTGATAGVLVCRAFSSRSRVNCVGVRCFESISATREEQAPPRTCWTRRGGGRVAVPIPLCAIWTGTDSAQGT